MSKLQKSYSNSSGKRFLRKLDILNGFKNTFMIIFINFFCSTCPERLRTKFAALRALATMVSRTPFYCFSGRLRERSKLPTLFSHWLLENFQNWFQILMAHIALNKSNVLTKRSIKIYVDRWKSHRPLPFLRLFQLSKDNWGHTYADNFNPFDFVRGLQITRHPNNFRCEAVSSRGSDSPITVLSSLFSTFLSFRRNTATKSIMYVSAHFDVRPGKTLFHLLLMSATLQDLAI